MVQRPMPAAQAWRVPDGAIEVVSGGLERLPVRQPSREVGRDRRGQRATGSMRMPLDDARATQFEGGRFAAGDVD